MDPFLTRSTQRFVRSLELLVPLLDRWAGTEPVHDFMHANTTCLCIHAYMYTFFICALATTPALFTLVADVQACPTPAKNARSELYDKSMASKLYYCFPGTVPMHAAGA